MNTTAVHRSAAPSAAGPAIPAYVEGQTAIRSAADVAADRARWSAWGRDVAIYGLLAVLVWAAWLIAEMDLFPTHGEVNYWFAVAGGSMMLVLFMYPLRKYLRVMQGVGKVKWWFWFHLCMGIAGPWLILVHSGFEVRSLNAGVAFYSMLTVVCSGVVGRFMYVRVHRGLDGERTSLRELSERAGLVEEQARSRLRYSPKVEAWLLEFQRRALATGEGWGAHLYRVTFLPLLQWFTYALCAVEVRRSLRLVASARRWPAEDLQRRERHSRRLVDAYLRAVVRVAQYEAYDGLFALWHLAHLPFIYLLLISAVVHVVAVHAY